MKVLVIAPSGLHLGYLGCYGNDWIETPALDGLAAEGVVFDNHFSDCPSADGAWRAWRTGLFDFPRREVQTGLLAPGSNELFTLLRDRNVPVWVMTVIREVASLEGLGVDSITTIQGKGSPGTLAKKVMKFVLQFEHQDHGLIWVQPDFLIPPWLLEEGNSEYFDGNSDDANSDSPIQPLSNPTLGSLDPNDETTFVRLQRTYATAVSWLDSELAELFDQLRQQELFDSVMIIATSDQGLPLGEHGWVGHGRTWLHEELVHIPLIIRLPHGDAGGMRIGALTQPVDLMPTLMEAVGLSSVETHGSSLLPLIRGEHERTRNFACSGLEIGGEVEYCVRMKDWAFLLPEGTTSVGSLLPLRERQLYLKPEDRWEVNNVFQHHPEAAEHLEKILREFIEAHGRRSIGLE